MKKRILLTKREIESCLKKHDGWNLNKKETELSRTFHFDSYINGLVYIARVAVHAEILNHHPDIQYTYNTVKITLTTHKLKALTKVDVALLERIELLYEKVNN